MISLRKLAHIGGALFVPLALYNQYLALAAAILCLIFFIFLEHLKKKFIPKFLRLLYRDQELGYMALEPLSYFLSIIALLALANVLMPAACYVAIIVMTVGDGFASVIGKSVSSPGLPYSRKTYAGTISGFIMAAALGYMVAGPPAIAGAAAGMIVEAYAGDHDNALVAAAALLGALAVSAVV